MAFCSKNKYKAVIFDLDGTLVDTSEGILISVKETIEHFGYALLNNEDFMSFMGGSIYDSFHKFFPNTATSLMVSYFRKRYSNVHFIEAHPYDSTGYVLKNLRDEGLKVGVATFKREDLARKLIASYPFGNYVNVVCGSDSDGLLTKTDIIKNCLSSLCVIDENDAIMVGDALNDAIASNRVGMPFVGVTYGYGFRSNEDFVNIPNIGLVNNLKDLLNIIK